MSRATRPVLPADGELVPFDLQTLIQAGRERGGVEVIVTDGMDDVSMVLEGKTARVSMATFASIMRGGA